MAAGARKVGIAAALAAAIAILAFFLVMRPGSDTIARLPVTVRPIPIEREVGEALEAASSEVEAVGTLKAGESETGIGGVVETEAGTPVPGTTVALCRLTPEAREFFAGGAFPDMGFGGFRGFRGGPFRGPGGPGGLLSEILRRGIRRIAAVRSDEAGRYGFAGIDPGAYRLLARKDGFLVRLTDPIEIPDGERVERDVTLPGGLRIAGRVVGTERTALAGAAVWIQWTPEGRGGPFAELGEGPERATNRLLSMRRRETSTDAAGRFAFTGLLEGIYLIGASAKGFSTEPGLRVEAGKEDVEIVLDVGLSITGAIVDREGGPVGGAEVRFLRAGERRRPFPFGMRAEPGGPSGVSRADGSFTVEGLRAGPYAAYVRCEGYQDRVEEGITVGEAGSPPVVIALDRGLVIEGIVFDPRERPVGGARVVASPRFPRPRGGRGRGPGRGPGRGGEGDRGRFWSQWRDRFETLRATGVLPGMRRFETATGPDGRFRFTSLGPLTYDVSVELPPYVPATESGVEPGGEPLRIRLSPGVEIAGRVIAAEGGEPVAEAAVLVMRQEGWGGAMRSARSGEDGRFAVSGVEAGPVRVRVRARGFLPVWFEMEAPEPDAELPVDRAGEVTGRVVDASGTGIAGARVSLRSAEEGRRGFFRGGGSARSGPDGAFAIPIERGEGTFQAAADHPEYLSGRSEPFAIADPSADMTGIVVMLRRGASLEGTVTDGQGAPIPNASVSAYPAQQDQQGGRGRGPRGRGFRPPWARGGRSRTTVDGAYRLTGLEAGPHVLRIDAEGFMPYRKDGIVLAEGGASRWDAVLEPENAIEGRVSDMAGQPLPGAVVTIRRGGSGRAVADQDGLFRLGRLGEEVLEVEARYPGYSPVRRRGVAPNTFQEFVLMPYGAIAGVVYGASDREPATPFRIRLAPADPESFGGDWGALRPRGFDDPDGAFQIDGLPPGTYDLTAETGVFLPGRLKVEIPPGEVLQVEIPLDEGAAIVGKVLDPDAQPLADAQVRAVRVEAGRRQEGGSGRPERQPFGLMARGGPPDRGARGDSGPRIRPAGRDRSSDRGAFRLTALEAGKYIVEASHDDYVAVTSKPVDIVPDGPPPKVELRLKKGARVRGQVLADAEDVARGIWVRLNGPGGSKNARVGEDGSFTIRGLAPGRYEVRAYSRSRRGSSDPVTVDVVEQRDAEVEIALQ